MSFAAPARLATCGTLALAALAAAPAGAQALQGGVDVSVGAEVSSNPYLEQGASDVTASGSARVFPWVQYDNGRTAYTLDGSFEGRAFTSGGYDFEDNYSLNAGISHRASERLTLRARTGIFSTASSFSSLLAGVSGPIDGPPLPTVPNPIDPGEDVTVLGQLGRNSALLFSAGADMTFDARNQLQVSGDFRDSWSNRPNAEDYRSYGAQSRFMHVLDQSTSIGTDLSYQQTDYQQATAGDARTISTLGSLSHRLGQYWTLDASAGASFTRIDPTPASPELDFTSFSVRANLCSRTERRGLCFEYRRQPEPSAFGGVRNSDNFDFSFDQRVSQRDRLSLGLGFVRSGESRIDPVAFPKIDYLNLRGQFRRQFSNRVSAFVSGTLSRVDRPDVEVDPSVTVGAGITVSLGRPQ